jgi:hypothetical protein
MAELVDARDSKTPVLGSPQRLSEAGTARNGQKWPQVG